MAAKWDKVSQDIAVNELAKIQIIPRVDQSFLSPTRVTVLESIWECHDTVTLTVNASSNSANNPISWHPGQFNMLYLFGLGEVALSISGPSNDSNRVSHTVKAVGPVTKALTQLSVGDEVWIRGPYGSVWPEIDESDDLLIVAGGIGIAPLRPVMFNRAGKNTSGKTMLLYGTRSPADVLFSDDLVQWQQEKNVTIYVTVDHVSPDQTWQGSVGVVTNLLHHLRLNPKKTVVLTCGPEVMMRHVATDLGLMDIRDDQIFVSMERNMKCAVGLCGRCQWGARFVCRDGPVYRLSEIRRFWSVKEF